MTDILETPTVPLPADDALSRDIVRLQDLKATITALEEEKSILTERICKEIDAVGHPVTCEDSSGNIMRAAVSRSVTKEVNLVRLMDIDHDLYRYITKPVVDTKQLDRAIHSGKFSSPEHMSVITVKERSPYVRIFPVDQGE